jgi:hypothetical protein
MAKVCQKKTNDVTSCYVGGNKINLFIHTHTWPHKTKQQIRAQFMPRIYFKIHHLKKESKNNHKQNGGVVAP